MLGETSLWKCINCQLCHSTFFVRFLSVVKVCVLRQNDQIESNCLKICLKWWIFVVIRFSMCINDIFCSIKIENHNTFIHLLHTIKSCNHCFQSLMCVCVCVAFNFSGTHIHYWDFQFQNGISSYLNWWHFGGKWASSYALHSAIAI